MVVSSTVFPMTKVRLRPLVAVCLAALATMSAHAIERITLRSGFTVDCAHHEMVGDHIRLYTGVSGDYQEFSMLQVANIELLPDLPKPIVLAKAPSVSTFSPAAAYATAARPEQDVHDLLLREGANHNIDVELLASIIHTESGYKVKAVSRAGARGLMQLLPSTARTFGAHDLFKAEENIAAGTAFLDELLKRYNDNLALALAAYNAGPGAVERYHGVPPFRETRAYVTRVINEFYRRKIALGATPASKQQALASAAPVVPAPLAAAALRLASAPADGMSLR